MNNNLQDDRQRRRAELNNLLNVLSRVECDFGVMESENAPMVFRELLEIERWLRREYEPVAIGGYWRPSEMVPPTYRLHDRELLHAPMIPAEIVGIGDRQAAMTVFARFPEFAQLPGVNEFVVGFEDDDDLLQVVEFARVDSASGDRLPTPDGALLGLFDALLATCRYELDLWRINAAHLEDIALPRNGG